MESLSLRPLVLLVLLVAIGSACVNVKTRVIESTSEQSDSLTRPFTDYRMPSDSLDSSYRGLRVYLIRNFYAKRSERLFWTHNDTATASADSLITFIRNVKYFGLSPDDYQIGEIQNLSANLKKAENIFRFEALLTNAYITLVQHISFGKTARISLRSDSISFSALENSSQKGGVINNITRWESRAPGYTSLKKGLKLMLDSLPFQQRQADLARVSVQQQIQIVEINLERWRLEKADFGSRYIFINIPSFMLQLIDNDSMVMESRIIVGTPETPTPELSSTIECFITYPYWHVPRKIAVEEYLPIIQRDTAFLARNNFDVLDRNGNVLEPGSLDWKKFNKNYFPVRLRQQEGTANALGVIKFMFDNPYAVFLHDTNAKRLFNNRARALSHGCIRMERAVDLSHYLVTGDLRKKSKYVERYLKEASRHTVELTNPIAIHARYYTADFANGKVNFYNDVYEKDAVLLKELRNNSLTIGQ